MKRNFLALIFLLSIILSGTVYKSSAQEFKTGDNVLSLGLGIGSSLGSSGYSSQSPGISLQFEHGQWEVGGPGTISLGGFLGFKSYKYEYLYYPYNYSQKYSYTVIGIRSAYHFNMIQAQHLDVYAGLMLSYNLVSYSYSGPSIYNGSHDNSYLGLSLYAGGRYYFTDNIAAFLELGYGVAYLNIGGSYKF